MLRKYWHKSVIAGAVGIAGCGFVAPTSAIAAEWEEQSSYYEDDAWYDISEWFDGNDYNPVDEVVGEWDNETYGSNSISSDADNDASYGYTDSQSDWYYDYDYTPYYDYYDYDLNDEVYEYSTHYYDYDQDGTYDAYASYYDWDADGIYEDVNYYSFNDAAGESNSATADTSGGRDQSESASRNQQATDQQATNRSSRRVELQGTVKNTKEVKTRTGKHLIADLSTDQGQMAVDLGRAKNAQQWSISQDTQLTVRGTSAKVGDKRVLIAREVKVADGEMQQVNRERASIQGKIASTKKVQVRGTERQLAIVDLKDKDKQLMVDLGPANTFESELQEGAEVKIQGMPVRVKGKAAILASSIEFNGEKKQIDRRQKKSQKEQVARAK